MCLIKAVIKLKRDSSFWKRGCWMVDTAETNPERRVNFCSNAILHSWYFMFTLDWNTKVEPSGACYPAKAFWDFYQTLCLDQKIQIFSSSHALLGMSLTCRWYDLRPPLNHVFCWLPHPDPLLLSPSPSSWFLTPFSWLPSPDSHCQLFARVSEQAASTHLELAPVTAGTYYSITVLLQVLITELLYYCRYLLLYYCNTAGTYCLQCILPPCNTPECTVFTSFKL